MRSLLRAFRTARPLSTKVALQQAPRSVHPRTELATVDVSSGDVRSVPSDALVVNAFEDGTDLSGATLAVDESLKGAIHRARKRGDFQAKLGEVLWVYPNESDPIASPRVLVVGLGKHGDFSSARVRTAAAKASAAASRAGVRHLTSVLHGAGAGGLPPDVSARVVTEGLLLGAYEPLRYGKKIEDHLRGIEKVTLVELSGDVAELQQATADARNAAMGTWTARDLANAPGNIIYPETLARAASEMCEAAGIRCSIVGEQELQELGMGMMLAVGQGSERASQLLVMDYVPGRSDEKPLVLVGKGVTFDTGGICIKPGDLSMGLMKMDMGGAAAVIGAMQTIAATRTPRRVTAICPLVENMPSGRAYRPGDVLESLCGKTAEVVNTDAEGRLILADALQFASRDKPAAIVDAATLTGAVNVALGPFCAGVFSNNAGLMSSLMCAAESSGERVWPLPLYPEYRTTIKSNIADLKNCGSRFSGVASSAVFLEHFVENKVPWAHIDIAGVAWNEAGAGDLGPQGATGFGARLLAALAGRDLALDLEEAPIVCRTR